jgi:hypothetical protein
MKSIRRTLGLNKHKIVKNKKKKINEILEIKYFDKPPQKEIHTFSESFIVDEGIIPNNNAIKK